MTLIDNLKDEGFGNMRGHEFTRLRQNHESKR